MKRMDDDELLTINEAAAYLKVSRRQFSDFRKLPDFPAEIRLTLNGYPRFLAGDIKTWVKSHRVAA